MTVAPARTSAADILSRLPGVREVVREHAARCDRDAVFPEAALTALRRSGLLGLTVPAGDGGPGGTLAQMLHASAELSRDCTSVGMIFTMHCQQVDALVRYGSPRLRAELLPRIVRGELYLGSVTTEPKGGGHLLTSSARLHGDAAALTVDRIAPVLTGGGYADGFLITMQAPGARSPGEVSLVYAARDQLAVTPAGGWDPLGMRATASGAMRLCGEIPGDQVIGEHGRFRDIAVAVFGPLAHLGWAACWLGAADGALARTVRLLRSPAERGRTGSETARRRLSRVRQRLDTVHALIQHACGVLTAGVENVTAPPAQLLLNAVKLTASEQCLAAVDDLVELAGLRHGYQRGSELGLERTLRDLRSASLNYSNDRLHDADGVLVMLDREVRHV
ncbi:acyl-CoA dehydrogenase family protein [Catenuloplanes indicus]|uniref:Acyl-CoA dehydrogenase n=1 Tax=Catenuloplanes indicus TaxID=137267 RepID=A0AAE3VWJ7_9ACTN|nr:acyl-CoA dehydrogenase family protein [Catenuloplanes indicus]MDQ0364917.1 acyl-CoA dehydrogenase [Catenuloplanes indicus]